MSYLRTLSEIRRLQIAIALCGVIPIGAGLAGALEGIRMVDPSVTSVSLDSHYRYLSGLLLGIGLTYWALIPGIERRGGAFRMLTLLVFIGGLGRLAGLVTYATPSLPMLGGLVMELVVTPLLCLWQFRIARDGDDGPGGS
jgi:hypothetical protein